MKLLSLAPVVVIALFAAACSGNDGEIKVDAGQTPLTDQGKDTLFTVEIVKARDGGYASDTFKVKVTPDGKDAIDVTCTFNDVNSNKTLDVGDKLSCVESAENNLGIDIAGKEAKVELFATIDGSEERVGDATWTPPAK
jgi:hypothetical protein